MLVRSGQVESVTEFPYGMLLVPKRFDLIPIELSNSSFHRTGWDFYSNGISIRFVFDSICIYDCIRFDLHQIFSL